MTSGIWRSARTLVKPTVTGRSSFGHGLMGLVLAFLAGWVLPSRVEAQTTIDKAVLEKVKESTVYIKVKAGKQRSSGSGFAFKNLNGTILILTNRHVAVPDADELEPGEKVELSVVFRSGTPQEQELPGTLIGYDPRDIADLAVLEVKGVAMIPDLIKADLAVPESEFFETMQIYAIGFPLGANIQQVTGNVKQNPAVTVNPVTISSLRRDEYNRLARIQVAGSLIGGNSGGPVVDAKGRLVGVVVSRIVNENVGFVIPPGIVSNFLSGNMGEPILAEVLGSIGPGTQLKFVWKLVDPLNRISSIALRYSRVPIPPEGFKPINGGGFPVIAGGTDIKMMKEGDRVSTTFSLPINSEADRKLHIQFIRYDYNGKVIATGKPFPINIERPGRLYDLEETNRVATLAKWSCMTNLAEGIKIVDKPDVTTISLPAGVPLNNAPQYDLFNAPCALVKLKGDFAAVVVVQRTFDPGSEGVTVPTGKKLPFSFQSAGLLIWQDERNFVRFERAKRSEGPISMASQLLVEVYKNGRNVAAHYINIDDTPVLLAAVRQGASLHLLFSLPPNERKRFYEMSIDFKDEVFVGVAAANLSKRPFQAKLSEFALIDLERNPIEAKPFKMAKLIDAGFTKLPDGTRVFEGATMRQFGKVSDSVSAQTNMGDFKGSWSENRQLLWNNDKADGVLSLELPVDADGKYEIKGKFTQAPDYAIAKLELDGKPLYKGQKIDFYAPEVKATSLMSLGTYTLAKGKRKLNITIFNKNPKSSSYHFGIDELQLVPAK